MRAELKILKGVFAAGVWLLAAGMASAAPSTNKYKHTITERPVIIPRAPADDKPNKPEHPPHPNKTQPEGSMGDLVKQFQAAREAYLAKQQALLRQMREATAEERALLRQQFQETLEAWKEQQRQMLREQRDRASEIKQQLHSDLGRVVDEARGEGRGR